MKLYSSLREETIDLHFRWKLYRHLYAGSNEDLFLLNSCAPSIFGILQSLLFGDCVLRICRITDPNSRGKYENLSVFRLAESISNISAEHLECDLPQLLKDMDTACSKMRDLRNRKIAHTDLKQALQIAAEPLPEISIEDINATLRLLSKFLNNVAAPLRQPHTYYSDVLVPKGDDAERLLSLLRQANIQPSAH